MEEFEKPIENIFSDEQERKLGELMEIIRPLYFSMADSNIAYEFSDGVGRLEKSLKAQGFEPEKYLLWSLITTGSLTNSEANQEFDTPDQQIEDFIRAFKTPEHFEQAA
jgi:hypothetical protein